MKETINIQKGVNEFSAIREAKQEAGKIASRFFKKGADIVSITVNDSKSEIESTKPGGFLTFYDIVKYGFSSCYQCFIDSLPYEHAVKALQNELVEKYFKPRKNISREQFLHVVIKHSRNMAPAEACVFSANAIMAFEEIKNKGK